MKLDSAIHFLFSLQQEEFAEGLTLGEFANEPALRLAREMEGVEFGEFEVIMKLAVILKQELGATDNQTMTDLLVPVRHKCLELIESYVDQGFLPDRTDNKYKFYVGFLNREAKDCSEALTKAGYATERSNAIQQKLSALFDAAQAVARPELPLLQSAAEHVITDLAKSSNSETSIVAAPEQTLALPVPDPPDELFLPMPDKMAELNPERHEESLLRSKASEALIRK